MHTSSADPYRFIDHSSPAASRHELSGLIALLVQLAMVSAVVLSMSRFTQDERLEVLLPLAAGGLLIGYVLARSAVSDFTAHVIAIWLATSTTVFWVTAMEEPVSAIVRSRGRLILSRAGDLLDSLAGSRDESLTQGQIALLVGIVVALLAYSFAWVLHRRGWLGPALVPPIVLLVVTLRQRDGSALLPVAVFVGGALLLAARQSSLRLEQRWRRHASGDQSVNRMRIMGVAAPITVLVLLAGYLAPLGAPQALAEPAVEQAQSAWDDARDTVLERLGMQGDGSGNYAEFPDSFELGGEIELGDQIVATLDASQDHYLALRRYDAYNGDGWRSDVDSTFRLDGDSRSARVINVIFAPSQSVALSDAVATDRREVAAVITIVRPKDDLLFTIETYSRSNQSVVTVLGWQRLDQQVIDVSTVDVGSVPVDLQSLVRELNAAAFTLEDDVIIFDYPETAKRIEDEQRRLAAYPVKTDISVGEDGQLLLTVSGRVPNYDDVEAVFADSPVSSGEQYRVTGLETEASVEELQEARGDDPLWVTSRYLQLPDDVTDRTRQLAGTVVRESGATNRFDAAWALQDFLGNSFPYELNPEDGPSGQDFVDYFLFDGRTGRCEHYASAMVVMARSVGIPARLVSGYRSSGEMNELDQFVYREEQAHTWVEVYFPRYGWVPFEPTAGEDPFGYGEGEDADSETVIEDELTPTPTPEPVVSAEASPMPTPEERPASVVSDDDGGSRRNLVLGVLAAAGIAGLVTLFMLRTGPYRGLSPAGRLYAGLLRVGRAIGVRPSVSATPREYGQALSRRAPGSSQAIATVVQAYEWEQFGPPDGREPALQRAREAWSSLRRGFSRWRPWRRLLW